MPVEKAPVWPVVVTEEPIRLHTERVARSSNRRHWLAQVGDALFLDEFPGRGSFSLLGIGGSRATFIAPGDSALVWKLTSVEDEPNQKTGHGLDRAPFGDPPSRYLRL